jgi:hypothetical protein
MQASQQGPVGFQDHRLGSETPGQDGHHAEVPPYNKFNHLRWQTQGFRPTEVKGFLGRVANRSYSAHANSSVRGIRAVEALTSISAQRTQPIDDN